MRILLYTLFASFSITLTAQVNYDKRVEFESDEIIGSQGVTNFGKYGIIIRSQSDKSERGEDEWTFRHLDTDLNEVKKNSVTIDKSMWLDESELYENKLFSLFKDRKGNYELVVTDAISFDTKSLSGEFPKKTTVSNIAILNDYVYLEASSRRNPYLVLLNWKTGRNRVVPVELDGYKSKNIEIQNIQALPKTGEIFVFIQGQDSKKRSELFVMRLDGEGKKIEEFRLSDELEENIVSISVDSPKPGTYNYVGTYSSSSNYTAEGLFNALMVGSKFTYFNTYPFLDLDNFLTYLPERKQEKMERKKKRKEKRGKEFTPNYQIATHDIIPTHNGGYLLLGEAYYATYRSQSSTTYTTINGVSTPNTTYYSVFDGNQYTHAILCSFNGEGQLDWDQSFRMLQAYKPYYAKRFISLADQQGEQVDMVFSSANSIFSKSIGFDGSALRDEELTNVDTGDDDDRVKRSSTNLEYWYDNYFFVFGYQKIKNKGDDDELRGKRKVYFVNKVRY